MFLNPLTFYLKMFNSPKAGIGDLKMLGLYLYTLIIGHKSCNILSILKQCKRNWKLLFQIMCF